MGQNGKRKHVNKGINKRWKNKAATRQVNKRRALNIFQGVSEVKKRAFLLGYAQEGSIVAAAKVSGVDWRNHYTWLKADEVYREAFAFAYDLYTDFAEAEIIRRGFKGIDDPVVYQGAISGVWIDKEGRQVSKGTPGAVLIPLTVKRYSDLLAMFEMKKRRPEYREGGGSHIFMNCPVAVILEGPKQIEQKQEDARLINEGDGGSGK